MGAAGDVREVENPARKLVVLGAGAFAEGVADVASEISGVEIVAFVEGRRRNRCKDKLLGLPILWIDELAELESGHVLICATAQDGRSRFIEQARSLGARFTTLVHPTAHVSKSAAIGEGSLIMPGVVIGAQTSIGRHAIVNRGSLIGHHIKLGDYVTVSPGANIAGHAEVGDLCHIGMGSNIVDRNIRIGSNSTVGAGAVVLEDVPPSVTVFGVPASVVQSRPAVDTRGGTIRQLLGDRAAQLPEAPAISAPGRPPLAFAGLQDRVEQVRTDLRRFGVGREDRVAIVLPNGPEMAVAFLGVACAAIPAPLNPAYRESEYEFYLADLDVAAVVVEEGAKSPVISPAEKLGIKVLRLSPEVDGAAGSFNLQGAETPAAAPQESGARPQDVGLILHTSATTSRPKQVPLTHGNLCASAENTKSTLRLSSADVCLNVMPLFHIHGLAGALLSSIAAGGSIVCTPGFAGASFLDWLRETRATWYTAVPTIHQAVVGLLEVETPGRPLYAAYDLA